MKNEQKAWNSVNRFYLNEIKKSHDDLEKIFFEVENKGVLFKLLQNNTTNNFFQQFVLNKFNRLNNIQFTNPLLTFDNLFDPLNESEIKFNNWCDNLFLSCNTLEELVQTIIKFFPNEEEILDGAVLVDKNKKRLYDLYGNKLRKAVETIYEIVKFEQNKNFKINLIISKNLIPSSLIVVIIKCIQNSLIKEILKHNFFDKGELFLEITEILEKEEINKKFNTFVNSILLDSSALNHENANTDLVNESNLIILNFLSLNDNDELKKQLVLCENNLNNLLLNGNLKKVNEIFIFLETYSSLLYEKDIISLEEMRAIQDQAKSIDKICNNRYNFVVNITIIDDMVEFFKIKETLTRYINKNK